MSSVAKRNIAPITTAIFVSLGGVYFGLFSCGSYIWHSQLFYVVVTVLLLATLTYPANFIDNWYKKLIFLILLAAIYFVFEASSGAFYPTPANSLVEFVQLFWQGLVYGQC